MTTTSAAGSAHNPTVRVTQRVPVPDPDISDTDESQAEQPDSNPEE